MILIRFIHQSFYNKWYLQLLQYQLASSSTHFVCLTIPSISSSFLFWFFLLLRIATAPACMGRHATIFIFYSLIYNSEPSEQVICRHEKWKMKKSNWSNNPFTWKNNNNLHINLINLIIYIYFYKISS